MPVDFDGDGYHEFYGAGGAKKGCVVDREGKVQGFIGGDGVVRSGKIMQWPGELLMVYYQDEGKVRIWGDADAVESEYCKRDLHTAITGECSISWEPDITMAAAILPAECRKISNT